MFNRRDILKAASVASASYNSDQEKMREGELTSPVYAVVELMGHKRLCGRLQNSTVANLLQLDVPVEGGYVTQLINANSVYRISIVDEKTVRDYAKNIDPCPPIICEAPPMQRSMAYHDDEYWDER